MVLPDGIVVPSDRVATASHAIVDWFAVCQVWALAAPKIASNRTIASVIFFMLCSF